MSLLNIPVTAKLETRVSQNETNIATNTSNISANTSGLALIDYTTYSSANTWLDTTTAWNTDHSITTNVTRIGNLVAIHIDEQIHPGPDTTGSITSPVILNVAERPSSNVLLSTRVRYGGGPSYDFGLVVVTTAGTIVIHPNAAGNGNWPSGGDIGFSRMDIQYMI